MNDIADDFVSLIESMCEDGSNDEDANHGSCIRGFGDLVHRAGLETVSTLALDRRMGFLDTTISPDTKLIIDSIQGYQTASNQAMFGFPLWKFVHTSLSSVLTKLIKHKDNLCRIIGTLVDEALDDNLEDGAPDAEEQSSILKQLLRNPDLTTKDVKASVTDYITAGVDTIGNSIIFAIALIAKHPHVQERLHAEIDAVLSLGEHLTDTTISQMPYLRACVTESFRIYPTASQLARVTEEEFVTKSGIRLPAGTVVLCHHRIASLKEENFTNANEFCPERWLDSESFPVSEKKLIMPFGIGKRVCPGKRLAQQEIHIIVAKIFQKYEISLADDMIVEFNWLLTPERNMKVNVMHRS